MKTGCPKNRICKVWKAIFVIAMMLFLSMGQVSKGRAQSREGDVPKNAAFIEVFGNGILYSLNYERILLQGKVASLSFRAGITPCIARNLSGAGKGGQLFGLINLLAGKNRNYFEFGLGMNNHFNFDSDITYTEYRNGVIHTGRLYSSVPSPPYSMDITSQLSFRHILPRNYWFYRISFICSDLFERDGWGKLNHNILPWGGMSFGKMF